MNILGAENRDTLTHKTTGYSAKLLKKPDQCRMVYANSHLFWVDDQDGIKDGERVILCLKCALRIDNATRVRFQSEQSLFEQLLQPCIGNMSQPNSCYSTIANVTRGSNGLVTFC
uniref:Uncharacterized protein n=1 Tax=Nelumbo nucifera TaxID=4432 RepID=A0A822ZIB2_NELNU|nr:TPA_asm: hypothetical protein HUJ06_001621 [Nelumbo nucifera]